MEKNKTKTNRKLHSDNLSNNKKNYYSINYHFDNYQQIIPGITSACIPLRICNAAVKKVSPFGDQGFQKY